MMGCLPPWVKDADSAAMLFALIGADERSYALQGSRWTWALHVTVEQVEAVAELYPAVTDLDCIRNGYAELALHMRKLEVKNG